MRRIDRLLWPVVSRIQGYLLLLVFAPVVSVLVGHFAAKIRNEVAQTLILVAVLIVCTIWALVVTASHARFEQFRASQQQNVIPIASKRSRGRK